MPALTPPPARGVRRQPKRRSAAARWIGRGLKLAMLLAALAGGVFAWRSGRLPPVADMLETRAIALSAKGGFRVEDIDLIGREQTDLDALRAAVGLKRGDPILGFDPEEMRQRIESLSWVASAAVERRLPGTISITIIERKPIALWQHNDRFSLIDAEGANLGPAALDAAPKLPLVVGGDAPSHAAELLGMLADHPEIARRVQASSWIGSRRWDLKLDNGVEVKLPETGTADALKQLADAESASRLLERDVAAVDLRLPGKMVVRLAHAMPAPAKLGKPQQGI